MFNTVLVPLRKARTVLGDVEAALLGRVLCHEHLIIDSPIVARDFPHIHLPSVGTAVSEATETRMAGVATMVDAMPLHGGGDAERLAEISRGSGVHVVAATGMHTPKYYPPDGWMLTADVDQLGDRFTADIEREDAPRAGVIKVATAGKVPTGHERRLLEAVARAHHATGAPILTHCEEGLGGPAQLDAFAQHGVDLARVALSHTDKVADYSYHVDLIETGANLCLDQGLRDPERTADLAAHLASLDLTSRLLLGTDGARRSFWSALGGSPGLAWLASGFPALLTKRGLEPELLDSMFVSNPARWLAVSN